ncbi:MAG TPA: hypothetical protein VKU60_11990, partial [Chloroflexota bacterium]|nr:hypothetical protein [Chloroflexota bacterium]
LPLPFGTADMADWLGHGVDLSQLRSVSFWLGVGARDNDPSDLPRQWDAILGSTRVARAQAFDRALQRIQVPVELQVFPRTRHQLTAAMAAAAGAFLSRAAG